MASLLGAVAVLAVLSVGLCEEKNVLQRAGVAFASRPYRSVLTVNNGERYGTWKWTEMCPDKFFAIGFSVRVQSYQGRGDETAMNGIRLICGKDGKRNYMYTVESHSGYWGDWSGPQHCPSGLLTSFQLRVETYRYGNDNSAANNIKFRCSSNPMLEGSGTDWGEYGGWSQVCVNGGICGIETKMEDRQDRGDNTALNDVRFLCCDRA